MIPKELKDKYIATGKSDMERANSATPLKLSVIIPARNEFPNIVHTVHSVLSAWETSYELLGYNQEDLEIIIVNNCSTDREYPRTANKGTTEHLMPRGIYSNRYLRVVYDPLAGNHTARTTGARVARGEYVFFSDGHMSYAPKYFYWMIKACQESGGIVHSPIGWHGTYPPYEQSLGYQYTIKIGDEWRGTWAQRCLTKEDWFYIPALGHCSLLMRRDQFFRFGGYQDVHRAYGGGEMYLNMKWWMMGSTVVVEPRAVGYHLHSERGYAYLYDNYIENDLGCLYALGIDDWRERTYLNWLRKYNKNVLKEIMDRNEREHGKDRAFIERNRKYTFNEIIAERPWDKLNEQKHGKSNGGLQVFHDTWLPLLDGTPAKEAYENSKYQKDLEKFINEKLSAFVYKRNHE